MIEQRTRTLYPRDLFARTPPRLDKSEGSASGRQIVVSPLSNSGLRDWGMANYARLISLLLDRVDCRIVLVGSNAQRRQLDRLVEENGRHPRVTNLAGASDWSGTAEIVRAADLVIANNSGVAHLAAACGTPTLAHFAAACGARLIAIYSGAVLAEEWGPRGGNAIVTMTADVPCSPCGYDKLVECPNDHLCMKQIAPETVADQAIAILSDPKKRTHLAPSMTA